MVRNTCRYCGSRLYECTCGEELSIDVNFCFMCATPNPNKKDATHKQSVTTNGNTTNRNI